MEPELELITSILIVFLCAILILLIGRHLRLPFIIGYFITGIIVGPSCLGLITDEQVGLLADLGVILLMFTIGLEVSLKNLLSMKRIVLIGGLLQVCLVTAAVWALLHFGFGLENNIAILLGMMTSTSSTAIVLSIYQQTKDVEKPHGKIALGILIFQDLAVIPMMLICPMLSGGDTNIAYDIVKLVLGLLLLFLVLLASIVVVPKVLRRIASVRSRELFIIAIIAICFGIAWLASLTGASLALGAFLAGIAISSSDYCHEVIGQVMPIRDILTSFFFVSIGMMLDLNFFISNIALILILTIIFIALKIVVNTASIKAIGGVATGTALIAGLGLCQIGEFSFVLGTQGISLGIISQNLYQYFLGIAILSMVFTPFIIQFSPKIVARIFPGKDKLPDEKMHLSHGADETKPHAIIVGYGLTGRYVAQALHSIHIPYVVIELNPQTVEIEKLKGENIIYGDASHEALLDYVNIAQAKSIIITMPLMDSVKAIITLARRMNPDIRIITRSKFITEKIELHWLGADSVVVDERESATRLFHDVLIAENIPEDEINIHIATLRSDLYNTILKDHKSDKKTQVENKKSKLLLKVNQKKDFSQTDKSIVEPILVGEKSCVSGKRICDIPFRSELSLSVLAIKKSNEEVILSPEQNETINAGDTVVVIGEQQAILMARELFAVNER